jgi:hypothetical protein
MHTNNVRVPQLGGGAGFAQKLVGLGGGELTTARDLEGYDAVKLSVSGLVDCPEAAAP